MPGFSQRLGRVQVAASVAMTVKARELRAAGKPVITLTTGEPNFDSPPHAIEAAHQAALAGDTKYPPQDGTIAFKKAIQEKFKRDSGIDYAMDEICVGNGGKQCLFNAIMVTVDPGDEVIIPVPSWIAYAQMTQLCEGKPVFVNCPQNNGFKPRAEDIDAAVTPKTKWLVLNSPNNPTGAVMTEEDLKAIAAVMRKHPHVWLMCDDMYEHLIFGGFDHATMAQVAPDLKDRILTVSGVSKTYAMTGWRIGFAGGPKALIKAMVNMQGQATAGISTVGMAAAVAALNGPQDGAREQSAAYKRRRDIAVQMLNESPGISCHSPEGAFYVFPNVAGCLGKTTAGGKLLNTDQDVCLALLEEQYVATVHGAAYHMSPYLRISTATADDDLVEGLRRIQTFCEGLHSSQPPSIRPGRDSDAAGFIALTWACWSQYPGIRMDVDAEMPEYRALASYYADHGGALWVAEDGGKVAGMIATRPLPEGAWEICRVYVLPALHGGGLGHRLLDTAEAHAMAAGASRLMLWSDTRFDRAHRFYEKRSYVRAGPIRALADISNSLEYRFAKPVNGIEVLDTASAVSAVPRLCDILTACVTEGSGVSFLPPLAPEVAQMFWRDTARDVAAGKKLLLAGWVDGLLAGTVTLVLATPQNQPHRAEVVKMLVHPAGRRGGLARRLMARLEQEAMRVGRTMLTLDTRLGDRAEGLYRSMGWIEYGRIPGYAIQVDGTFEETLFMWKRAGAAEMSA